MYDSEFTDIIDSNSSICPYCGAGKEVEGCDESGYIEECDACGKKYHACDSVTIDHHSSPDCELNNEQHKYVLVTVSSGLQAYFCIVCDKCKSKED